MSLKTYRQKRDFSKTPEPWGDTISVSHSIFVIQKHNASHLHYDLRLEVNKVLKSWAIPKGPSLNPNAKRLAIQVEDHPLEYTNFEGNIPKGHYGAGEVIVWDRGTWKPEKNPIKSLRVGKLVFIIYGEKLKGRWTLVKIKGTDKNWLLIKNKDSFADNSFDINEKPRSVVSGIPIEKLKKPHLDNSLIKEAIKAKIPTFIKPQLAKLVTSIPESSEWIHEVKFDGYRIICIIRNKKIQLITRNKQDLTAKLKLLVDEIKTIPINNTILDGEIVVFDKEGRSRLQLLQNSLSNSKKEIKYCIFDIPFYESLDLSKTPLLKRKKLLKTILFHCKSKSYILYSNYIQGNGKIIFNNACKLGLEGIISKKIDSFYEQKRTNDWVKTKCKSQLKCVIGGYTKHNNRPFGALLLGYFKGEKLIYCGKVGTGFTELLLKQLYQKLIDRKQANSPFIETLNFKNSIYWVKPTLVAKIEFTEWTKNKRLRHPVFRGLYEESKQIKSSKVSKNTTVKLTNEGKILYPENQITKRQLVEFYSKISDWLLPQIIYRPLTLLRCPDGYNKECFFQKHFDKNTMPFIQNVEVQEKNKKRTYLSIRDKQGLINLIQIGVLEIHSGNSRNNHVESPDRLIFDLDPDPKINWESVTECAQNIKEVLNFFGLKSFVKLSGGKGLHIYIPIRPHPNWNEFYDFAKRFANLIVKINPGLYTTQLTKAKRIKKIFIDYIRNSKGSTCIAAYSTRAKKHAPISTPVGWSELSRIKSADQYNIGNIFRRLRALKKDPWEDFYTIQQKITKKMWKYF